MLEVLGFAMMAAIYSHSSEAQFTHHNSSSNPAVYISNLDESKTCFKVKTTIQAEHCSGDLEFYLFQDESGKMRFAGGEPYLVLKGRLQPSLYGFGPDHPCQARIEINERQVLVSATSDEKVKVNTATLSQFNLNRYILAPWLQSTLRVGPNLGRLTGYDLKTKTAVVRWNHLNCADTRVSFQDLKTAIPVYDAQDIICPTPYSVARAQARRRAAEAEDQERRRQDSNNETFNGIYSY